MRGNITFDPLAYALPVAKPAITEVLNLDDGTFIGTVDYISGQRYQDLVAVRVEVRERLSSDPLFVCSECNTPVYIVARPEKRFFFRHKIEDGSCRAQTRGTLSQEEIRARKFHGLRESKAHLRIKGLLDRSLLCDPTFSEVLQERTWRSTHDPTVRRQPDVQASGPSGRIAFEVQLSTTFLDVIASRRAFYRDEGALLMWVLGSFEPTYRRLTTDDLLFSNNSNIFVVDDETTRISEKKGSFHLRCHYRVPIRIGDRVEDRWEERIVCFHELTCERERQRIWHFDYDEALQSVSHELEQDELERERTADEALRQWLFEFWTIAGSKSDHGSDSCAQWQRLCTHFQARGVILPVTPDSDRCHRALLNAMLSVRNGEPVGWRFKSLIEVGHYLAEQHKPLLLAFGHAIRHFGREELLESQDRSGKWKGRQPVLRRALRNMDPAYLPDPSTMPLMAFLFPEIGAKIDAFCKARP